MKYQNWNIPEGIVEQTEQALLIGRHEVFAIWTTPRLAGNEGCAQISRCIVPAQTPGITAYGVSVHIAGQELQRIQLDNFQRNERSIIQLHTHPGEDVEMSELDREWEVVRHVGALSIIVPYYGTKGLMLGCGANVYEREDDDWRLWTSEEAKERLQIS
jgi:proteasome lid subunit RPN8/RPN11